MEFWGPRLGLCARNLGCCPSLAIHHLTSILHIESVRIEDAVLVANLESLVLLGEADVFHLRCFLALYLAHCL